MMDYTLEEDIPDEFKGGTLEINNEEHQADVKSSTSTKLPNKNRETVNNNENVWKTNLVAPFTHLTETLRGKKTEEKPQEKSVVQSSMASLARENANNFFTFRQYVIDKALKECVDQFLNTDVDGPLLGCFLLTEINIWDTEKERLVLLAKKSFVVVKYDFIALKSIEYKKVPLEMIDTVLIGNLVYPNGSLMPNRNMHGIRLMWNKGQPLNFTTIWNPFTKDVPFCTFTSHPLFYHKDCENLKLYSVDDLIATVEYAFEKLNNASLLGDVIHHQNILMDSYVGVGSLVHNRNALGFFKVRGKFSF